MLLQMSPSEQVSLTIDFPYAIPDSILEWVSIDTDSNSSYITKKTINNRSYVVIEFDNMSDLLNLNINKYLNVWDNALVEFNHLNPSKENYVRNNIKIINKIITEYILEMRELHKTFKVVKDGKQSVEWLDMMAGCKVIVNIKNELKVLSQVSIIKRGKSISDVVDIEELNNYSYKCNIRPSSLFLTKNKDMILLSEMPKKKSTAKQVLHLKPIHDLISFVPISDDVVIRCGKVVERHQ